MIEAPDAEFLLSTARQMLEQDGDMEPVLFFDAGEKAAMMPCMGVHPAMAISALGSAIEEGVLPRPSWIAVVTDSYHMVSTVGEVEETRRGDLGELFRAGDPRVGEALVVNCVSRLGTMFYAQQPYVRSGKNFIWKEVEDYSTETKSLGGVLIAAMQEVVGAPPDLDEPDIYYD